MIWWIRLVEFSWNAITSRKILLPGLSSTHVVMGSHKVGEIEAVCAAGSLGYFVGCFLMLLGLAAFILVLVCWFRRRSTYVKLTRAGLPTVYWRPKFVHYDAYSSSTSAKKLASSSITNILPRMKRLQGPYDMYGTVYGISTAVVHVAHPVPASTILTSVQQQAETTDASTTRRRSSSLLSSCGVRKAPAYNHFFNFCGQGVFTADEEDWRGKRAAVMHALMRKSGDETFTVQLERQAHTAANRLIRALSEEQQKRPNESFNVVPLLQRATVGLIYRYLTHSDLSEFGPDPDTAKVNNGSIDETDSHLTEETALSTGSSSAEENEPEQQSSQDGATNNGEFQEGTAPREALLATYMRSIQRIRMIILAQSRSIWFLLPRWCYRALSRMYQDEERTMVPIRNVARTACEEAKHGSPLASLQEVPIYQSVADGNLSKNMIDEAITLLFAGQDTSAATLSWTLHLLSLYPVVQMKLAKEVCTVMEAAQIDVKDRVDFLVSKRMVSQMPYLDAVIKESMRLYPVAPFVVRKLPWDVHLPSAQRESSTPSTVLPGGALACIWIYSLHRHPDFWSEPNEFRPERWMAQDDRDKGITAGAYMPFAMGPRNCVGQPLAHIVLRSLLARLIHRYEFRDEQVPATPKDDTFDPSPFRKDMEAGFTVLPQGGVMLSIRNRLQSRNNET